MIVYKDILPKLAQIGWTARKLRKERVFSESTMMSIRRNGAINTTTIDKVCSLLNCPVEEILCYVPDEEQGE